MFLRLNTFAVSVLITALPVVSAAWRTRRREWAASRVRAKSGGAIECNAHFHEGVNASTSFLD